jgi:YVTN family beta-propeller protein
VFFTDVSGGRLLILELRRLLENTDGFEPAAQVISVGAGPWDVALSPDETLAYVASRLGDNLHIVSTVTGEIIDSVDVGYSPISLHAGVGGGLLFVANRGSRSISVIDVSGLSNTGGVRGPLAVVDSISLSSVGGLTGTADGKLIVAAMPDHNAVAIVDTEGFSVRVVPVGDAPQTVVLGPDDRTAYVPNYASETISMIDVHTALVTGEIRLGGGGEGAVSVAVAPDGRHLYVTRWHGEVDEGPGRLEKIHLPSQTMVAAIEVGSQAYDVELSPDGRYASVSSFSGTVATVDLSLFEAVVTEIGAGWMGGLTFTRLR